MKTAEDIINEIERFSPLEYNKVEAYFHVTENGLNPEEEDEILRRWKNVEQGINLSPEFNSVDEMMAYIDSNLKNEQFNSSQNSSYGNRNTV